MKKIFAILFSLACVVGFTSCDNEVDDVFGEGSAHRLKHAIERYDNLLCEAENGWVMEYFATDQEEGFPMLVKFSKTKAATFGAKNKYSSNNKYAEETSMYDIIADNGPVLTFNTYNSLFHVFATPEDIPQTEDTDEQGYGHEGDYEFVIIEGDENHFKLVGKKHGLVINMSKLPADMEWSNYYAEMEALMEKLVSPRVPSLTLVAGEERYVVSGMHEGLLSFVPEGGDAVTQTIKAAFILQMNGNIHLAVPFKGVKENFSVQNFQMMDDGTFKCVDEGQNAYFEGPALKDMFITKNFDWHINPETLTGKFVAAYDAVVKQVKETIRSDFKFFGFRFEGKMGSYAICEHNGRGLGNIYITEEAVGENGMKFTTEFKADRNGGKDLQKMGTIKDFIELVVASEYEMSTPVPLAPTTIKFVSKADPNDSFEVVAQ